MVERRSRQHSAAYFENSHGVYVQDSFRVTPRLTFNYGVRWDYFGVVKRRTTCSTASTRRRR